MRTFPGLLLSTVAALATVASGCAPAPSAPAAAPPSGTQAATTPSAAQAVRGGVLSWAYTTIPTKMDPVWSQARTDGVVLSQIVQGLTVPKVDGTGVEPGVSDKWTVSDDGLTYTFHLRQGIKF